MEFRTPFKPPLKIPAVTWTCHEAGDCQSFGITGSRCRFLYVYGMFLSTRYEIQLGNVEVQDKVSGKNIVCNGFAFCSGSGWELLGRVYFCLYWFRCQLR